MCRIISKIGNLKFDFLFEVPGKHERETLEFEFEFKNDRKLKNEWERLKNKICSSNTEQEMKLWLDFVKYRKDWSGKDLDMVAVAHEFYIINEISLRFLRNDLKKKGKSLTPAVLIDRTNFKKPHLMMKKIKKI